MTGRVAWQGVGTEIKRSVLLLPVASDVAASHFLSSNFSNNLNTYKNTLKWKDSSGTYVRIPAEQQT